VDEVICCAFRLKHGMHLRQRGTSLKVARRRVPADEIVDLVRKLYERVGLNRGRHIPSTENWRWKPQIRIRDVNKSPEVVLERSIALLAEETHLSEWCNQIPVASGLVDHKSDKRTAVDLAKIAGGQLDLYELKLESDNPVYAAFEILQYGLAYLLCRVNKSEFGYAHLRTMKVNALGLNVLAPRSYYEGFDLGWLQAGLDAGIRAISQELRDPEFGASFRFVTLPDLERFASGANAKAACGVTPLIEPKALALVHAMSSLVPFYSTSGSA
jgi:hypothetical protein